MPHSSPVPCRGKFRREKIDRNNKDMQLILYSLGIWVIHSLGLGLGWVWVVLSVYELTPPLEVVYWAPPVRFGTNDLTSGRVCSNKKLPPQLQILNWSRP